MISLPPSAVTTSTVEMKPSTQERACASLLSTSVPSTSKISARKAGMGW